MRCPISTTALPRIPSLIHPINSKFSKRGWSGPPTWAFPGYSTAPIDEAFNTFVIPTMMAKAARDEMSPEDAVKAAEKEMKRIFEKWEKR